MRAQVRNALLAVSLTATAACDRICQGDDLGNIPIPGDQVDVFTQKGAARVDILWMIDNSGSMAAEQAKIAARFNDFFNQLITSQVDYHIGVISSDPAEGGVLRQYPQDAPSVGGCEGCRFLTKDVSCANPAVAVSSTDTESQVEAKLADECQAQLVFRKLVQTGITGSSFEEGFRVAALALGADVIGPDGFPVKEPPALNEGFLREDASLFIIFVSDEDEGGKAQDGTPIKYYQRLFEGLKTAGNENKVSVSAITGWPFDDALPSADELCGILQTGFDGDNTNDDAQLPAVKDVFTQPEQNRCIDASGDPTDGNAYAETGGRYIQLACATGGVVSNMCEADYSTALDKLGANAAGLLRKFAISKPTELEAGADCEPFTDDDNGSKLDCNENNTTNDACIDDVICVTATPLGAAEGSEPTVIPRRNCDADGNPIDGPPNWSFEPGTSSVRFEGNFIPAPGSTVTIRYPLKPTSRTCP